MTDETILSANNITVHFGQRLVLNQLSLDIRRGEVVAVKGENGSGKTTLIRALSGELRNVEGFVRLLDTDISRVPQWKRVRLGVRAVSQVSQIVPSLYASEFSALSEWLLGSQVCVTEQYEDWLRTESQRHSHGRVGELSAGQQRRVYVSAMLRGPIRALLLDEPTAGTSRSFADQLCECLSHMARRGLAVCIIEHDMSRLDRCVSRIVKLEGGRLVS